MKNLKKFMYNCFSNNFSYIIKFNKLLKENGRIIITTSEVAPLAPMPFNGIYNVTKTALDSYSQALRQELNLINDARYLDRLEEEARVKKVIGEKLNTCMYAYPNTLQHYIDLFWECGSIVGPGRGSSVCFLSNYLFSFFNIP